MALAARTVSKGLLRRLRSSLPSVSQISALPYKLPPHGFCSSSVVKEEATAMEMIKYSKSLKEDEASYAEAVRVLQQGLSFFTGDSLSSAIAAARLQLTLATLHANRSNFEAAAECLQDLSNSKSSSFEARGAASEALTGLFLQMHQDKAALNHACRFGELVKEIDNNHDEERMPALKCRAAALKRLVDLAFMSNDSDKEDKSSSINIEVASGPALVAFAEFSHLQGSSSIAKTYYEKAIDKSRKQMLEDTKDLSAIAMVPEAVQVGALAGLGQLLTSMGHFDEAENHLTEALKQAEKFKGEKHPQVGMILSCIGNLYHQRGITQGTNETLLSEGLYRRALDLMNTPPLDKDCDAKEHLVEIMALTRARLGITLSPALHRHGEIERLKLWAERAWSNSRAPPDLLLLGELLSNSHPKILQKDRSDTERNTLVEIRLGRAFFK